MKSLKSSLYFASLIFSLSLPGPSLRAEKGGVRPAERPNRPGEAPRNETPENRTRRLEEEEATRRREQERSNTRGSGSGSVTEGVIGSGGNRIETRSHEGQPNRVGETAASRAPRRSSPAQGESQWVEVKQNLERVLGSNAKEIIGELETQYKSYKDQPEAQRGLVVKEQLLLDVLKGKSQMDEKAAKDFSESLLKKLKTGENISREDLEGLKQLSCSADCGHPGTAPACRRTVNFLKAAAGLSAV
ncbi:MAG: hypothetical protein ACKOA8_13365, partial [Deltaproteobacteria bacterium]